MLETYVALLRGINVGTSGRLAMSDLRDLVAGLGFSDVRTVLNSGNVVFDSPGIGADAACLRIQEALAERLGLSARVIVLSAAELVDVVADNPLGKIATNPSRLIVAFPAAADDMRRLDPLLELDWAGEALAVGRRAAYLWCPDGVVASPVAKALGRALGDSVTSRNWSTVGKLHSLVTSRGA